MFLDSSPTPLDLKFRVGPFPVRVSPWFFLGMGVIGWDFARLGVAPFLIWIACGFVTILWHELGHAAAGKYFGRRSEISLIAFGGYAQFVDGGPPSGWRNLAMVLAGPAANFLLAGTLFVSDDSLNWTEYGWGPTLAYYFLMVQNLGWGLFNLLPLWPLDGGRALREVLYICGVRRPDVPTHYAGLAGGATMAALCVLVAFNPDHPLVRDVPFVSASLWMVFLFGMIAYQNQQMLQTYSRVGRPDDDENDRRWRGYR